MVSEFDSIVTVITAHCKQLQAFCLALQVTGVVLK